MRVSSNTADMSDLEVAIILMSLQLAKDTWWLPSLLSSPSLDTVDTALSSWPRSTPRKEHRSFLIVELQTKVHEDFTIMEKAPTCYYGILIHGKYT